MRALCMLLALVGCSGGGDTTDGGPDASDGGGNDIQVADCACIDATPPKTITVLNAQGTALVSFDALSAGNTAPLATIGGNQTNLSGAIAVSADAQRNLYVVTQLAILVFPPGASGNVAPARTIAGSNALAATEDFAGIAVAADGTIYAASELASGTSRNAKINVFAPGANGNVAPVRTIGGATTTMNTLLSMALSPTQVVDADGTQSALFFDNQASGDVAPQRSLKTGAGLAVGVALGATGDLWVASWNFSTSSAVHWAAGAQGTDAPTGTIAGPSTKITAIGGIAVDTDGTTFVANADPGGAAVLVFAPNTTGDTAPIRAITGSNTTLSGDASQGPMPLIVY